MFTHEKFEAYQLAINFTEIALQLMGSLPTVQSSLRDQLRRAPFSVPLNIAEGTGKNSQSDRKRFYAIARGSAMECAAVCDIIALLDKKFVPKTIRRTTEALEDFKHRVRELTGFSTGVSMQFRIAKLNEYVRGWMGYFGIFQFWTPIEELDSWIRRRLRMCLWKQ